MAWVSYAELTCNDGSVAILIDSQLRRLQLISCVKWQSFAQDRSALCWFGTATDLPAETVAAGNGICTPIVEMFGAIAESL